MGTSKGLRLIAYGILFIAGLILSPKAMAAKPNVLSETMCGDIMYVIENYNERDRLTMDIDSIHSFVLCISGWQTPTPPDDYRAVWFPGYRVPIFYKEYIKPAVEMVKMYFNRSDFKAIYPSQDLTRDTLCNTVEVRSICAAPDSDVTSRPLFRIRTFYAYSCEENDWKFYRREFEDLESAQP